MKKSSLPSRRQPLARSKKPIKRSKYAYEGDLRVRRKKRKPSEFARIYGSKERVEWVKSLPCAACGVVGYSENAHLLGNDGMGRKADYTEIGPLCRDGVRFDRVGCHTAFDAIRTAFYARFPNFAPAQVAVDTEAAWLEYQSTQSNPEGER